MDECDEVLMKMKQVIDFYYSFKAKYCLNCDYYRDSRRGTRCSRFSKKIDILTVYFCLKHKAGQKRLI